MSNNVPDNWYETFFTGINCEMWEKAATDEWTESEVAFLTDILNVTKGSNLLDMPCGTGRHSVELAKKGFSVTAIDISKQFINGLKKKVKEQQLNIEVIEGNILSLNISGSFDGAFCFGNSFGYFDYTGMETFVEKVSTCLIQGAKWVINTGTLAELFLQTL